MQATIDLLVWFYNQRAGAENLIKEANNDAGLAAHPSKRWDDQLRAFPVGDAGLQPELLADAVQPGGKGASRRSAAHHLGDGALRFLFVAAKIWRHAGRVGVSYSDQYPERGLFQRLMDRLRDITAGPTGFLPVFDTPLSG